MIRKGAETYSWSLLLFRFFYLLFLFFVAFFSFLLLLQQKRSLTRFLKEAFYKRILGRKERETELKTKKVDIDKLRR